MIRVINEETGKEVLTIKDNGDTVVDGKVTESEIELTEAFKRAQEKGE